jgi:magnesium-transporting ATPase (P-type)
VTQASRISRLLIAAALMAISANYFLKYLWWSAFYSGSSGLGSHSQQVQNASVRSTTYLWTVILLQLVTFAVLWSTVKLRSNNSFDFLWQGVRLAASLTLTIGGTALLVLVLAWIQPGIH